MRNVNRDITRIELAKYQPHPRWMRGKIDPAASAAMLASLQAQGQLMPFIVFANWIIDGNTRAEAMRLGGITHADAIVLEEEPTDAAVLEVQLGLEVRSNVPTTKRARTLAALQETVKCTVTDLAKRVGLTQGMCSKLLALDKSPAEIKSLLDNGKIDIEGAYLLSQSPDPQLLKEAPALSREQLRRKVKQQGKPAPKLPAVTLQLPGNFFVRLKGPDLTISLLSDVLQDAAKQVRKAESKRHDITSVERYFRVSAQAKTE